VVKFYHTQKGHRAAIALALFCFMSKLKVIRPIKRGENFAAIYKFTLDNGFFYVGGTKKIAKRMSQHRAHIRDGNHADNVMKAVEGCNTMTFEILERVDDLSILGEREDYYLKLYWGNPLMLNRAESAKGGFKRNPEEIEKHRQGAYRSAGSPKRAAAMSVVFKKKWKEDAAFRERLLAGQRKTKVASFKGEEYLQTFESCAEAERAYGINRGAVMRVLRGMQLTAYGYSFKKVLEDGSFAEPHKFEIPWNQSGVEAVRVLVMDRSGTVVFDCKSGSEAAQKTGVDKRTIHKVFLGKQKTANGFIFKRLGQILSPE
jgi:predicted GIY-YIG superfamily endonuclease